jgi:hypothetical protein
VYQTLFKSTYVAVYHPVLSILSMESNLIWYYNRMFGLGLGYGFSLNYPATFDNDLSGHPLVKQHEIRLIPFSFQTGGFIGFNFQLLTTLNFHNTIYETPEDAELENQDNLDEFTIIFTKIGLNIGLMINLSDSYAIYWNGMTINYGIPLGDKYENSDTEILPFSLDLGSIGFSLRF